MNTDETKHAALKSLKKLESYLAEKHLSMDQWVQSLHEKKKYDVIQEYISSLDMMPSSIRQNFAMIKKYLRVIHDIKLDRDDVKELINIPTLSEIDREAMTVDKIKLLCKHSSPYYKALWLMLSSSGMRISEALQVTPKMIDFDSDPVMVRLPARIVKGKKKPRITFISQEAMEQISQVDFFETHNRNAVESYFGKLRYRAGLIDKYEESINYTTNIHAFRSFFRTQAGKINYDFAEQILGHHGYLSQYIRLTDEEKTEYYKKLEPKLRIY